MDNTCTKELHFADLRRLGTSYTADDPLRLEVHLDRVDIVPRPQSRRRDLVGVGSMLGLCVALFVVPTVWLKPDVGPALWLLLPPIALASFGPVVLRRKRIAYLAERSPLVSVRTTDGSVSILKHQHRFAADDVYCLLAAAIRSDDPSWDSDWYCEMQLIIREDGNLAPYLITTHIAADPKWAYGDLLHEFREATGIRVMVADAPGLFSRKTPQLKDLE